MKNITLEELLEAGCHFGHQKRRWNPAMTKFIYGEKDGVHVIDLAKTKAGIEAAQDFARKIVSEGGLVLYVGTKRQGSDTVKQAAISVGMPYVSVRWMGGFLTNFNHIQKSIFKLADQKTKRESGELMKYTKKERLLIDRDIAKLDKFFGGVSSLTKLPDALFVIDTHKEEVAVKEAIKVGVPVIGIVDTNGNPSGIDYVIPANDDAAKSIELIINAVTEAIASTKGEGLSTKEKKEKKGKKEQENEEVKIDVEEAEKIEEKLVEDL